jgi:hypothetical protein
MVYGQLTVNDLGRTRTISGSLVFSLKVEFTATLDQNSNVRDKES